MPIKIIVCEFCDKIKFDKKYIQKINVCPHCGKKLMTLVIDDEPEKVKK